MVFFTSIETFKLQIIFSKSGYVTFINKNKDKFLKNLNLEFLINSGGGLFRLTSANLTFNYSFNNSSTKESERNEAAIEESVRNGGRDDDLFGRSMDSSSEAFSRNDKEEVEDIPNELYNYKIPWSLRMAYAIN